LDELVGPSVANRAKAMALSACHSGSAADRENARLTNRFCQHLRRFLAREPLLNVLKIAALY